MEAFIYINMQTILMTFGSAGSKQVQWNGVHTIDLLFVRYVIQVLVSQLAMMKMGQSYFNGCTSLRIFLQLQFRGLLSLLAFPAVIVSVLFIPMVVQSLVHSTYGFWTGILAYFILGEHFSIR